MRISIFLCGLLLSYSVYSGAELPKGCKPLMVQGESVMIKGKDAKIILIHNVAQSDLWITHPVAEPSASAGWTSRLQADHWSALFVAKPPFALNCIESRPGHEQQIPCEGAIIVCAWSKVAHGEKNQATFWAAENMPLGALTTALGTRGLLPKKGI